jgi:CubicO group peptidase (beta-lactamase class C family)
VIGGFVHGDSVEYAGVWRNYAISGNNLSAIDLIVNDTMQKIGAPGLSLAIAQSGRLVFAKAFGYSDAASKTPLTTSDRFRIGGISELVTATAIQLLAARGRLRLDDRVFGAGALLGGRFGTPPYAAALRKMTVRQLLAHTAGWPSGAADPTRTSPATTPAALVSWSLDHVALAHAPGTTDSPSRLDYVILARIVERLTSQPYAAWVAAHVLAPAGIHDVQLAAAARAPNEVADVDRAHEDLGRLDGAAGFIATPVDLVRLAVHLDDAAHPPDNEAWSQRAGLPGASAIVVRTAGEFTWAAAVNAPDADAALDAMMWRIVSSVTAWPSRDFFATP